MPISRRTISPVHFRDSGFRNPFFIAASVTVLLARIQAPCARPESAFSPDGTSIASTGTPDAFTASIARLNGSCRVPSNPVPNIASMIKSKPSVETAPSKTFRDESPACLNRSKWRSAAPLSRSAGFKKIVSIRADLPAMPASAPNFSGFSLRFNIRAAARPSPPLLPRPQRIRMFQGWGFPLD